MTDHPWGPVWAWRAVTTQANAAGGAIRLDFTVPDGSQMLILSCLAANSGTNTVQIMRLDEDGNEAARFVDVASGAGTNGAFPQPGPGATNNGQLSDSTDPLTRLFSGASGDTFTVRQTGAGAQNDTLTVSVRFLLHGEGPSVSKANSTNPNDVTISTPTQNELI